MTMRKKVLLAEQSDAIRSIAESILHQNGYDVISADSADKAKELIITAQPNILIIGADLVDSSGNHLYDILDTSETTSRIPLLLIDDPNGRQIPYPPEVILPRPFDPKDFMEKVTLFVGGGEAKPKETVTTEEPFTGGSVDDEFLDAALGIDNIEVEDSEVMDKTWITGKLRTIAKAAAKDDALDVAQKQVEDNGTEHRKVESLMIRDGEDTPTDNESTATDSVSESSKIELSSDQYGLKDKQEELPDESQEPASADHDYDWFLKEMQKEGDDKTKTASGSQKLDDSGIVKTPASDSLEQINDSQGTSQKPVTTQAAEVKPGGVDQFISDFKKEAEQISADMEPAVSENDLKDKFEQEIITGDTVAPSTDIGPAISEESIPDSKKVKGKTVAAKEHIKAQSVSTIDPEEIHRMCMYLAELLAEKLAKKIADRIDPDELYKMVKDELPELIAQKK